MRLLTIICLIYFVASGTIKAAPSDSTRIDSTLIPSSLNLPLITIKANRQQQFQCDTHVENIDMQTIQSQAGSNLGQLLQSHSSVNIKAYGSGGGLSTVSLRGANSSQTQINWNGFSINSITLGSCDLSMVPSAGFQNVSIVYGAAGTLYGSGTFGGAINLDNNASFGNKLEAETWYGYNTLKTNMIGAKINASSKRIAYNSVIWSNDSKNVFTYYDYINEKERTQKDGAWNDAGFMQNVSIKTSSTSSLEAGAWYQVKAYHIPSIIGSTTYGFQKDSALRFYGRYKQKFNHSAFDAKAAWFMQNQTYNYDSKIKGKQIYADISYIQQISKTLSAHTAINASLLKADVTAYQVLKREYNIAPFAALKFKTAKWDAHLSWRYDWSKDYLSKQVWSSGVVYHIVPEVWLVRANFSQKYRRPTFNDLYWIPGGNLNLKPESGNSFETGSNIVIKRENKYQLTGDLSIYYYLINNMITWKPSGAIWEAQNYQEVESKGAEMTISFLTLYPSFNYKGNLSVNLNHAVNTDTQNPNDALKGHILPYSPRIITSFHNTITYNKAGIDIWHSFTADRFVDDKQLLEPFQLVGTRLFAGININSLILTASIQCDNIFNTTYELITLYPMPPRTFSFRININIK